MSKLNSDLKNRVKKIYPELKREARRLGAAILGSVLLVVVSSGAQEELHTLYDNLWIIN